nr:MAG: RNA-dependent RNA polymerase [Porcine picobirnavirus]
MSKRKETNLMGNYAELPNPGLRAYFEHVVQGQPEEYRTPFFKGKSLDEILNGWKPTLDKVGEQWPTLLEYENDLAKKVGPMSIMKPLKERMGDIDSYYDSILLDSKPIPESALRAVLKEWGKYGGLRLKDVWTTINDMKKSTNSGLPAFTKRSSFLEKYSFSGPELSPDGLDLWYETKNLKTRERTMWEGAAVLGWRGQEGGREVDDVKQRVVWMFPVQVNIAELQAYQPLIQSAQRGLLVPAWVSMEEVDRRITQMFDTKGPDDLVVCTDFSKFDQHFNSDMQNAARYILQHLFTKSEHFAGWIDEVFPIKYMIPLMYDWNKVRHGLHGMGSGSGGTNADETLTHRALQHEAAISAGVSLNPNSQCLGDDGVLTYPGITVEDVVQVYSSHGQEMNVDKQYASKHDCTYLRRWHHTDYRINGVCVGVYSTYRALGRLAEQERYYDPDVWGPKMVALRQLSILENCKYHPLREEFADYCMKGDKFRLGLDIPGFFENLEAEARKATEYMPDFLGYTKSLQAERKDGQMQTGISNWWIVNYLKSKA